jgi:hypothetical protein
MMVLIELLVLALGKHSFLCIRICLDVCRTSNFRLKFLLAVKISISMQKRYFYKIKYCSSIITVRKFIEIIVILEISWYRFKMCFEASFFLYNFLKYHIFHLA